VTIAFRALKLIGIDVPAQIHSVKAALEQKVEQTRGEIRLAARHAAIVAAFTAAAVLAAMGLVAIGLVALYIRVAEFYGVYAGLAAVAGVLVLVIVVSIIVADHRSRAPSARPTAPPPPSPEVPPVAPQAAARRDDLTDAPVDRASAHEAPSDTTADLHSDLLSPIGVLLEDYLTSGAAHPLLSAGLRHMRSAAQEPEGDPIDLATDVVRDGDRTSLLAVLAAAAALGWMAARTMRSD
jgi:hypothetical protein